MENLYRLYVVVSQAAVREMKGNRGRMTTQAGHGFVHAMWDAQDRFPSSVTAYRDQPSAFKITLVVQDEEHLQALYDHYSPICGTTMVVERGTRADGSINEDVQGITCVGIGPLRSDLVGDDLAGLKPFL